LVCRLVFATNPTSLATVPPPLPLFHSFPPPLFVLSHSLRVRFCACVCRVCRVCRVRCGQCEKFVAEYRDVVLFNFEEEVDAGRVCSGLDMCITDPTAPRFPHSAFTTDPSRVAVSWFTYGTTPPPLIIVVVTIIITSGMSDAAHPPEPTNSSLATWSATPNGPSLGVVQGYSKSYLPAFVAPPRPLAVCPFSPTRHDTTRHDQRPTTNDQRPTTNDQRPTTNDQRPTTNDQRPTTNDQRHTAEGICTMR
jgi:hypothetical protein